MVGGPKISNFTTLTTKQAHDAATSQKETNVPPKNMKTGPLSLVSVQRYVKSCKD